MLTPDLGGMEGNGFQPANTVGGGGMVWEGRLFRFAPASYIWGALHAMPASAWSSDKFCFMVL